MPEPLPPVVRTVEISKPLPQSARDACDVVQDDGTIGGYIEALEAALTRCQGEIEARLQGGV